MLTSGSSSKSERTNELPMNPAPPVTSTFLKSSLSPPQRHGTLRDAVIRGDDTHIRTAGHAVRKVRRSKADTRAGSFTCGPVTSAGVVYERCLTVVGTRRPPRHPLLRLAGLKRHMRLACGPPPTGRRAHSAAHPHAFVARGKYLHFLNDDTEFPCSKPGRGSRSRHEFGRSEFTEARGRTGNGWPVAVRRVLP